MVGMIVPTDTTIIITILIIMITITGMGTEMAGDIIVEQEMG
jgi:hypothetical protein